MGETTLHMKALAELGQLERFTAAVREAREELEAFQAAQRGGGGRSDGRIGMNYYGPTGDGPPATGGGGGGPPSPPSEGPPTWDGDRNRPARSGGGLIARTWGATRSFVSSAASTAIGIGLGSSVTGFFLQSGQKYMELSRIMAQLDARFRSAEGSVASFGYTLGYTMAQAGPMIEILGAQTRTVDRGTFGRLGGLARWTGTDPSTVFGALGSVQRLTRGGLDDNRVAEILGTAIAKQMDQGRFGEFLQTTASMAEAMLARSGQATLEGVLGAQRLPAYIFGADDPRSQGSRGAGFIESMSGAMNRGPMRTFMLRSMGVGRPGGPSYKDALQQLERGFYDWSNVATLFKGMSGMGYGEDEMFLAFQSAAPELGARNIADMVRAFTSGGGIEGARKAWYADVGARKAGMGAMSAGDRRAYAAAGWQGAGQRKISRGEAFATQLETMQLEVGGIVSEVFTDIRSTLAHIARSMEKMMGADIGTLITNLTGAIEGLSGYLERVTPDPSTVMGTAPGYRGFGATVGQIANLRGAGRYHEAGIFAEATLGQNPFDIAGGVRRALFHLPSPGDATAIIMQDPDLRWRLESVVGRGGANVGGGE